MIFTLEVLPAEEGDCLLLHWGTLDKPHVAVIDGGPRLVYENSLKLRLEDILDNRKLAQLDIEFVMVSHVDNDHIMGIKKMFERMKSEVQQNLGDRPFRVRYLWHNTFNDILGDQLDKYYDTFATAFTASVGGDPDAIVVKMLASALQARAGLAQDEAEHEANDIGLILAGHGEGRDLRVSHKFLYERHQVAGLNLPFKKNGRATLITAERSLDPIHGLKIRVVGPLEAEIRALQADFDAYIKDKGLTAEVVLAAYADTSVRNLSSIVCLVEFGGKRILFTGDARGDKILQELAQTTQFNEGVLTVDVLKVPHHGSDRNVKREFFDSIIAETYVFSGNGGNGNPDRSTFEMLFAARDKMDAYNVVLTYSVAEIDRKRKAYANSRHKVWDFDADSLEALLGATSQQGYHFKILEGAPRKVELGDEQINW
jgi:hypothetical protein